MASISLPGFATVVVALLTTSAIGNVFLYNKLNHVEKQSENIDRRLMVFVDVTAAIVKEGKVLRGDVLRSGMIGYPPYKVGKDYLIDFDEHFEQGILIQFDTQDRVIGWKEYPSNNRGQTTVSIRHTI